MTTKTTDAKGYPNVDVTPGEFAYILRLAGLNTDLTSDMSNPRNACFCLPLDDSDKERDAFDLALICLDCAVAGGADSPASDYEQMFKQCLVDARRMVSDPDFEEIFGGSTHPAIRKPRQ